MSPVFVFVLLCFTWLHCFHLPFIKKICWARGSHLRKSRSHRRSLLTDKTNNNNKSIPHSSVWFVTDLSHQLHLSICDKHTWLGAQNTSDSCEPKGMWLKSQVLNHRQLSCQPRPRSCRLLPRCKRFVTLMRRSLHLSFLVARLKTQASPRPGPSWSRSCGSAASCTASVGSASTFGRIQAQMFVVARANTPSTADQ